jgi:hypothetical protein
MRTLAVCTSLLALAGCAAKQRGPAAACPVSALSPLLGCYRVVDARALPPGAEGGIQVGSLLRFADGDVSLYNDELTWVRMTVDWAKPEAGNRLAGKYRMGGEVALEDKGGTLVILEGSTELARAVRLEDAAGVARLDAIPTLPAIRERARACFAAYAELLPDDKTLASIRPESLESTASAHGILGVAQTNLARACKPIPEPCALPPMSAQQRQSIAKMVADCAPKN